MHLQDNCPKNAVKYPNQVLCKTRVVVSGDPSSARRKPVLLARCGCPCGIVDSERKGELGQIRFRIICMPRSDSLFCHTHISVLSSTNINRVQRLEKEDLICGNVLMEPPARQDVALLESNSVMTIVSHPSFSVSGTLLRPEY